MSKSQMEKALKIVVLGARVEMNPVPWFLLSNKAPIKSVRDGVSQRLDGKEIYRVSASYYKVVNEKHKTRSVMLHFDLEYLPDSWTMCCIQ